MNNESEESSIETSVQRLKYDYGPVTIISVYDYKQSRQVKLSVVEAADRKDPTLFHFVVKRLSGGLLEHMTHTFDIPFEAIKAANFVLEEYGLCLTKDYNSIGNSDALVLEDIQKPGIKPDTSMGRSSGNELDWEPDYLETSVLCSADFDITGRFEGIRQ